MGLDADQECKDIDVGAPASSHAVRIYVRFETYQRDMERCSGSGYRERAGSRRLVRMSILLRDRPAMALGPGLAVCGVATALSMATHALVPVVSHC